MTRVSPDGNKTHNVSHLFADILRHSSVADSVEIHEIPEKGLGVVAKRDLPKGTRIIKETPVLFSDWDMESIHRIYRSLDESKRREIERLCHAPVQRGPMNPVDLYNVWKAIPSRHAGILLLISRINHSCVPNAILYPHMTLQQIVIHLTRNVRAGEEITISYCDPCHLPTSDERNKQLQTLYHFTCSCPACTTDKAASDRRRAELRNTDITPATARRLLNVMSEDGIGERMTSVM